MSYLGDIRIGDTIDHKFTTRQFSTGIPFTFAGTPAVAAYVGNGTTEITTGVALTVDFNGKTGLNNVRVEATIGNGFAAGTNVYIVITAGTVDSVSIVGETICSFSIEARLAVMPSDVSLAVWSRVIDGTRTSEELLRGIVAPLLGKSSDHAAGTPKYRNIDDTKDVVSATTDADGNRTSVTLDLT